MVDTIKEIICPACGEKMRKIFMPSEGINVDFCEKCGGLFFDNRELEKFDETEENIDKIIEQIKNKQFIDTDTNAVRICPVCETPMVKNGSGKGIVEVDVCNVCGGKFLDKQELQNIRQGEPVKISEEAYRVMDLMFNENYAKVTHNLNNSVLDKMYSPKRRQFFEALVGKFI